MNMFRSKIAKFTGTDARELGRKARNIYKAIASRTKRKPYIRSTFFNKEKVFLGYFWTHLEDMSARDRARRLKYYPCAIDLIISSRAEPTVKINPNKRSEKLYRFIGITQNGEMFAVQVKEDLKRKEKHFISVFPYNIE